MHATPVARQITVNHATPVVIQIVVVYNATLVAIQTVIHVTPVAQ